MNCTIEIFEVKPMVKCIIKALFCIFFLVTFSFFSTLLIIKFPSYPKEFRLWFGFAGGMIWSFGMDIIDEIFRLLN